MVIPPSLTHKNTSAESLQIPSGLLPLKEPTFVWLRVVCSPLQQFEGLFYHRLWCSDDTYGLTGVTCESVHADGTFCTFSRLFFQLLIIPKNLERTPRLFGAQTDCQGSNATQRTRPAIRFLSPPGTGNQWFLPSGMTGEGSNRFQLGPQS